MDGGGGNRGEAERWLYTANKLLSARDLHGARSFAIRARESDPTFDASELLLTVIDTLLAGETRINDQHRDWYGILQILRYTTNIDHIASQYRRLALLLDPHRNPFAFAAHAFSLIHDAWSVLSNPAKKAMYDADLRLLTSTPPPPQQQQQHHQHHNHPPPPQHQPQPQATPRRNPRSKDGAAYDPSRQNRSAAESTRQTRTTTAGSSDAAAESSFWTSCPYCYVLYEYPKVYEECTLRCQSCRRGFHAVVIRSPPLNGRDSSFCSWGFLPLGFSRDSKDVNGSSSNWNPFSPLFPCPLKGSSNRRKASWTYYDDEAAAAFVELSDPSEDDSDDGDWRTGGKKGRKRSRVSKRRDYGPADGGGGNVRRGRPRKGSQGGDGGAEHENVGGGGSGGADGGGGGAVVAGGGRAESGKKAALGGSRRRGAGNLDLNVEFSNDVEEPSRRGGVREGNAAGNAEDNIEGIGFFEGLDEFLSSLPILNVVADDKSGPSETNATLEFAVNTLKVEHILVIGHSCCGGIRALMSIQDDANASFIRSWVVAGKNARINTEAAASDLNFDQQCRHCEKESDNHSLLNLLTYPWIEEKVAYGELFLHGGYYDFIECSFEKWTLGYRETKMAENGRIAAVNKMFWS